jgi:radical SAM protein with 4Fe4S-binding SPASM domain
MPFADELGRPEVMSLIEQAAELGVKRIAFTGGEPLLNRSVFDYIRAAHESVDRVYLETSHPGIRQHTITRLVDCGLDVLNLSIDSVDASQHDAWRGRPGLFDRMIETARSGVAAGLDVRIYCTVTAKTIDRCLELPQLIDERVCTPAGGKLGVLTFAYFVPVGRGSLHQRSLAVPAAEWHDFCAKLAERIAELRDRIGPVRYEPAFLTRSEHSECVRQLPYDFECIARGRDYVYVNPQGKVYGCVLLAGTEHSLGSVRERPLADIWLGSTHWGLFDATDSNHEHGGHSCTSACPALAALNQQAHDPRCAEAGPLIPICPLTQLPMIEAWPYARPADQRAESAV